jgi:lipoprotein-anchoring transpeptidase ErfK/SrfK
MLCFILLGFSPKEDGSMEEPIVDFLREYLQIKYRGVSFENFIYVAAKRQQLFLIHGNKVVERYTISTALNGIGGQSGSFKTPPGLHKVAEKIGEGLETNTIIKYKVSTESQAEVVKEARSTELDHITSRIMHLRGMEATVNLGEGCDSYTRGIFIHGTHEEGLLGTAASKGCVRMANEDIIDLFNRVEVGTFVVILNN